MRIKLRSLTPSCLSHQDYTAILWLEYIYGSIDVIDMWHLAQLSTWSIKVILNVYVWIQQIFTKSTEVHSIQDQVLKCLLHHRLGMGTQHAQLACEPMRVCSSVSVKHTLQCLHICTSRSVSPMRTAPTIRPFCSTTFTYSTPAC